MVNTHHQFLTKNLSFQVFPVSTMKAYGESGGTAPYIPKLSTRWTRVAKFMPSMILPQGKNSDNY